jgi:hypothetical protein
MPAILVFGWLLIPTLVLVGPAPKDSDTKGKDEPAAERIKKALDKVMDLDIENQSLQMAFAQLKEQTKVNFVLDATMAGMMGIDVNNTPVNLKAPKKKLRASLRTLLAPYNLTFGIVGDTVLISTEDVVIYRQLKQKVNLDLDKAVFATALKQLARESGVNMLVDSRVQKESQSTVTLQLEDVPLDTAVRLLSEMAGLKPVRLGNVLFVTTKASAHELRAEAELAPNPQPRVSPDGDVIIGGMRGLMVAPGGAAVPAPFAPPVPVAPPAPPTDTPAKPAEKKDEKPDAEKPTEEKPKIEKIKD